MPERTIGAVLKTAEVLVASVGSNPTPSVFLSMYYSEGFVEGLLESCHDLTV